MKIDPCPCVISLNDGSVHTLFEFRHFLELCFALYLRTISEAEAAVFEETVAF